LRSFRLAVPPAWQPHPHGGWKGGHGCVLVPAFDMAEGSAWTCCLGSQYVLPWPNAPAMRGVTWTGTGGVPRRAGPLSRGHRTPPWPLRRRPGLVLTVAAHYTFSPVGPYLELVVSVPVRFAGPDRDVRHGDGRELRRLARSRPGQLGLSEGDGHALVVGGGQGRVAALGRACPRGARPSEGKQLPGARALPVTPGP
jgi:hypothetical protein